MLPPNDLDWSITRVLWPPISGIFVTFVWIWWSSFWLCLKLYHKLFPQLLPGKKRGTGHFYVSMCFWRVKKFVRRSCLSSSKSPWCHPEKASHSRRPRGAYRASTVARAAVPTEKPTRTLLWSAVVGRSSLILVTDNTAKPSFLTKKMLIGIKKRWHKLVYAKYLATGLLNGFLPLAIM